MKYYLIAPLKLNLPPLEYESREILRENDIAKISVKNKSLLGIVLCEVEKPKFKCKEAVKSEFALSESQVVLGKFVADYYCTNLGVAFGLFVAKKCAESSLRGSGEAATKQSTIKLNPCDSTKSRPLRGAKNWEKGCSSATADFLLEADKRGSPPKSEKRELLARRGSGAGGAALLREKTHESNKQNGESNSNSTLQHCDSSNLDSCDLDSSLTSFAHNDEFGVDCFGESNDSPRNDGRGDSPLQNYDSSNLTPRVLDSSLRASRFAHNDKVGVVESRNDEFALDSQNSLAPTLSPSQQKALNFILTHEKTLLFGDTGSGKTEIYINAICATLAQGKNVLFLMPEIALTPQMERRLKCVFGDLVCIWHSKVSKAKKERILAHLDSIKIIAGARSALFLPLTNLGLIIVDEEHDEAYKATTNPRYNARDLAIFLSQKQGIRLILGSATPSVTSYYHFSRQNCVFRLKGGYFQGKKNIIFDNDLENIPQILVDKIATALESKKQIIIFVPMRGNFKVLQCAECGSGVKCKHCSINMSLHSRKNALICHYCGYAEPFFDGKTKCKICGSNSFKALKIGTQEVYKNLSAHFKSAKIAIFDRDEVKSDSRLRRILSDFNDNKIDILVGTQMISKGHDYHNVELVAILGIDSLLNSSDFRANERATSLLFQISGRTGRKNDGEVFINTQNSAFFRRFLGDYEDFLRFELENRANLYPPFARIALICAQNKDESKAKEILQNAKKIVESTRRIVEIVGLNKAPIERIGGLWRYFMLLRAKSAKELLNALVPIKDMPLIIDIDPQQII